ncbi:MAG: Cof-type HAD-IIB family hydrolase [Erysipelotrichaceae bacterium]|nr:Cof-type HAD-IIB family hydrolase [Erysipelotrichaceae bacterium]
MIKAIFFDIDGTLINYSRHMPLSTVKALKALKAQNTKLFIASGRPPSMLNEIINEVPVEFDGFILLNGQYCYIDHHVIRDLSFDDQQIRSVLDFLKEKRIGTLIVDTTGTYANITNDDTMQEEFLMTLKELGVTQYNESHLGTYPVRQLMAHIKSDDQETLEQFFELMPDAKGLRWNHFSMDVVHTISGKDKGIDAICEELGIGLEETMAFGDGDNDIDMIKHAGIGVAMGNAIETLKKNADYITDDVNEDGLYNALLHFNVLSQNSE